MPGSMSASLKSQVTSISDENAGRPAAKRRKLRRGTSSCWECKRRKVRCDFDSDFTGACVCCRRRGTRCVLQDVPEEECSYDGYHDSYHEVEQGIVRVETMVDQLIHDPKALSIASSTPPQTSKNSSAVKSRKAAIHQGKDRKGQPLSRKLSSEPPRSRKLLPLVRKESSQVTKSDRLRESSMCNSVGYEPVLGSSSPFSLSRIVYSYLPPTHIAVQILRRGRFKSFPLQMLRKPLMSFLKQTGAEEHPSLSESLEPTAQPIILARKLIQLAICLQQMDPGSDTSQLCLDGSIRDVATRFMNAASSYVTSQDPLIVSLDGLETLMLEGHFHLSSGQYKLAWLVFRRAMGVAQLLGLHASQSRSQTEAPDTVSETPQANFIWFRLVYLNHFLSMMLSLPITNLDDGFALPERLLKEQPLEKLERLHASIMRRIAIRNDCMRVGDEMREILYDHYQETQNIDFELKQAGRIMPTRWWTVPAMRDAAPDMETKEDTARLVLQIHQYNLLTSLHAPYVIPGPRTRAAKEGSTPDYSYSVVSALSASRESLVRFPILSRSTLLPFSARGINFKAFISATTLLLAHIDGHRLKRANVLEHQRPGDLGMIDNVIEILQVFADRRSDDMDLSCVRVLRTLLGIEADAADGTEYDVWSEAPAVGEIDCIMERNELGIELMVPTVGTIHIAQITKKLQSSCQNSSSGLLNKADNTTKFGGILDRRDTSNCLGTRTDNIATAQPQLSHPLVAEESQCENEEDIDAKGLPSFSPMCPSGVDPFWLIRRRADL